MMRCLAALAIVATTLMPAHAQILDLQPKQQIVAADQRHTLLRTNNYYTTISTPVNYVMQFNLYTGTVVNRAWMNILHVTSTGTNCCGYGTRIPGLWWRGNTRRLYLTDGQANGNGNDECPNTFNMAASSTYVVRVEMLATWTRLFINGTLRCQENRAGRRAFDTAYVYLSDPWHATADASVGDFWFAPQTVTAGYDTVNLIGPQWVQLERATNVGAVAIPLDFTVEFMIMPNATTLASWGSILHITGTGNSCCTYGDRIPGIWFRPRTRTFYFIDGHFTYTGATGGTAGDDSCAASNNLAANQAYNIKLWMNLDNVTIYIDNQVVCTEPRNDRAVFNAADVWISNPWEAAALAMVANVSITDNTFVPTNTTLAPGVQSNIDDISAISVAQSQLIVQGSSLATSLNLVASNISSQIVALSSGVTDSQSTTLSSALAATASATAQVSSMVFVTGQTASTTTQSFVGQLSSAVDTQMSNRVSTATATAMSSIQSIANSINTAVGNLPLASSPSRVMGTPEIVADSTGMHINGNGASISLETECGSVSPCDVLRALNALRSL